MKKKIINFQRKLRASLSIFYNKEEKQTPRERKLISKINFLAQNLIKLDKKNYKVTHKVFSQNILKLILEKKLLNFLQLSFIQKMFFVHNRLFLKKYLDQLINSKNKTFWKKLIKEINVGNPIRFFLYPKSSGNKIFQTFHLKKYYDFNKSNLLKYKFIFEFGGGYGNMAHTFKRINPKIKYIIFDTPEVNLLQYYYLSKCNLSVGIGIKNIYKNIVLLSSIDELKKIIKINQFKKKLFIANWSLSETPLIFREKLKFIFKYFDDQLISFQNKFEKVDNFKFFKKINAINIKKKRMSIIIPVPMLKNNNYLFSKKINEKN
jgi:hypothetical protein